ncbi:MAG: hypothetical protein B7Z37_21555 [Verrucomicrobia bacterium 12-59-8]|nr:MAG: hypothetical protein B7Z37_21555 [Verrucomicrobia bacterium 12-59-8]
MRKRADRKNHRGTMNAEISRRDVFQASVSIVIRFAAAQLWLIWPSLQPQDSTCHEAQDVDSTVEVTREIGTPQRWDFESVLSGEGRDSGVKGEGRRFGIIIGGKMI